MRIKVCFLLLVTGGLFFLLTDRNSSSEIYGSYLGWKACAECHDEEANGWQKTRHSRAFENLKTAGQADLPDCVRCHVVAYNIEGGFIDEELTAELGGVQCEECHGPGITHVEDPEKPEAVVASPSEQICRKCHTPGQDANFDYDRLVMEVHGR